MGQNDIGFDYEVEGTPAFIKHVDHKFPRYKKKPAKYAHKDLLLISKQVMIHKTRTIKNKLLLCTVHRKAT